MAKAIFSSSDYTATAGASLEGVQNTFKIPIKGGYISMDVAQATLTFKLKVRFYNGVAWTKYYYLKDPDLVGNETAFNPISAAVKCLFLLQDQDYFPYPIYGVQVYYERVSGSVDAEISNAVLEVYR